MRKLIVFNHVSLDGFIADAQGDMSFFHGGADDAEWNAFVEGNASGGGTLLFGRVTYDMMASFWPSPMAAQRLPLVAERMNSLPKVVFSRTMDAASWQNTRLVKGELADEVRKMKNEPGSGMAIMGSGTIVSQLTEAGLIDEYLIVVNPLVLGSGRTMFQSIRERTPLRLTKTRSFQNGKVLLCYDRTKA